MPISAALLSALLYGISAAALSCASTGVGAYRTEELQPYVLSVVRKASRTLPHRWDRQMDPCCWLGGGAAAAAGRLIA